MPGQSAYRAKTCRAKTYRAKCDCSLKKRQSNNNCQAKGECLAVEATVAGGGKMRKSRNASRTALKVVSARKHSKQYAEREFEPEQRSCDGGSNGQRP